MKGKLIVIDGNDGSGKKTQTDLLLKLLTDKGHSVKTIDFPRYYDNFFGGFLAECLRGEHGNFVDLNPKIASALFAADRFESKQQIVEWLKQGHVVVADRYATANMIHQGGKISDEVEREKFMTWLEEMEFGTFGIPKPDIVLYLDVSVDASLANLAGKKESYTKESKDQHEASRSFLENSREAALWLCKQNPNWQMVVCADEEGMRSVEEISSDIIELVSKHL